MESTVESLCNQLARSRLLAPDAIRSLRTRWRTEMPAVASDLGQFSKWLSTAGYLTDFQVGMITRGFSELLFVNDYKLLDRIGQGRMAGVYRAVHPSGQTVAIKVLPPSKAKNRQLLARFQREARMAERLKHDNVVRTFQHGKTSTGLHFIVMEYLEGETLEDVLQRRGKLSVPEALSIVTQTLEGLDHLHEEGLVHRDVKPANLMLVPAAGSTPESTKNAVVKILDIGLGRVLFDEGGEPADLTSEGTLLGTPQYMAPEQARSAHTADIRADIYSLGCILYEMLGGQTPFSEPNFVRQMLLHATATPKSLQELNPSIPDNVHALVKMMMARDPAMRYAVPSQALKAFKAVLPPEPVKPEPPKPLKSYLTWLETRPAEDDDSLDLNGPPPATKTPSPPAPPAPAAPPALGILVPKTATAAPPAPTAPPATPVATPAPPTAAPVTARPAAAPTAPAALAPPANANPKAAKVALQKVIAQIQRVEIKRRDWIFAILGVVVVLIVQGLFWLISKLF